MDNYSITRHGIPLDPSLYIIDFVQKFFSTKEGGLVLDFSDQEGWTFVTGYYSTFTTGNKCTFETGDLCVFFTGERCTFKTGEGCMFSLWRISTHTFKSFDGNSIILDRLGKERYVLNKELVQMLKIGKV